MGVGIAEGLFFDRGFPSWIWQCLHHAYPEVLGDPSKNGGPTDCCTQQFLSGILAKSGPLDFATKNCFPLFFVCEKGLVHMYQNHFIYFPILYFRFATSQKPILPATGSRR